MIVINNAHTKRTAILPDSAKAGLMVIYAVLHFYRFNYHNDILLCMNKEAVVPLKYIYLRTIEILQVL